MIKLNEETKPDEFINHIDGKELVIYEDIQGSKIYVRYNGDRFIIKSKSLKNDEINFVDLAYQKFYGKCYAFFHTLPSYVTDILNKNWWFQFEYLPDEKPGNIEYNRIPRNNLVLTSIVKKGHHKFNYEEILEYSKLFDVEPIPLIFKGKLSPKQIEVLSLYIKTSQDDLKFIFGSDSFAKFFYNILNPNIENSFLMKDDEFNENLEKIVVRIDGDDKYTFAILNPLYTKNSEENQTEHTHVFSLIIISFLEFLQLKDIHKYKPKGLTKDELYINLISLLFNEYIANMKEDIEGWEFFVPNFIKDDKFKINVDLIRNKDTQNLIKSSDKIEYIYKVILGSFNKYRKKPIGIMKESTVDIFNTTVKEINDHLEYLLSVNRDYRFQKIDLMNFGEYFNLEFDRDGAGEIYPDVSVQFEEEPTTEFGKDKKGKKGIYKKK